ncbi:unnamed protein product [Malus baccata var. baccata]
MACLVSTTLSLPLSASHSFEKGIAPRRLSLVVRLSSQQISETVIFEIRFELDFIQKNSWLPKEICLKSQGGEKQKMIERDGRNKKPKIYNSLVDIYKPRNVHSCRHTIIFGFWVGPDIDDGWGYVEAFFLRVNNGQNVGVNNGQNVDENA